MKRRRLEHSSEVHLRNAPLPALEWERASVILGVAVRALLPLLLLFSIFLLLRGHHAPGGGFIGGLVAAAAVALYALAYGATAAQQLLRLSPRGLVAAGLATALASALVGPLTGAPFLTGRWMKVGRLELGTPLLFDVGVFLVVIGVTLWIVLTLAEE
ncbi:Na(+)/H(+) antiporter subunit B [bacterium HR08]|nr:Na(+)/H(+) antiporter subunit B [bacterium HR08]